MCCAGGLFVETIRLLKKTFGSMILILKQLLQSH